MGEGCCSIFWASPHRGAAAPYPVLHENCNSSNRCALPGAARVHAHSTSLKLEEAIDPRTVSTSNIKTS
eukprot:scaffold263688_cov18-Tisochrysis_lutea.AAC.1